MIYIFPTIYYSNLAGQNNPLLNVWLSEPYFAQLQAEKATLDSKLTEVQGDLESTIEERNTLLVTNNENVTLRQQLSDRDQQIEEQNREMASLRAEIERLKRNKKRKIARIRSAIDSSDESADNISVGVKAEVKTEFKSE